MLTSNVKDSSRRIKKYLFTADEYQKMGELGVFKNETRIELINGEIIHMSPISNTHNAHVDKVSRFFNHIFYESAIVRTQGSIRTNQYSEPEPDIVLLKKEVSFYNQRRAEVDDVLLVVEVAIYSKDTDRTIKKRLYASSGVKEYWIVLPEEGTVEVYKSPKESDYVVSFQFEKSDSWTFEPLNWEIKGTDLLI